MTSAGLILYRIKDGELEVFLVHPGGPLWETRDIGAWSIPKGLVEESDSDIRGAAIREFHEETGFELPTSNLISLGEITQKSGKIVHAWAIRDTIGVDPTLMTSNLIEIEYPRHSNTLITIPEVDRGTFFSMAMAEVKINPAQAPLLHRLSAELNT